MKNAAIVALDLFCHESTAVFSYSDLLGQALCGAVGGCQYFTEKSPQKMEAVLSFEISVPIYHTTWFHKQRSQYEPSALQKCQIS